MKSKIIKGGNHKKPFDPKTSNYPVLVRNQDQVILLISRHSAAILADNDSEEENCLHVLSSDELRDGWEGYWVLDTETTITFLP